MDSNAITLELLAKAMEDKIAANGGIDAVLSHYDHVYSETFRSEPLPLLEMLVDPCQEDIDKAVREIKQSVIDAMFRADCPELFIKETASEEEQYQMDNEDFDWEEYNDQIDAANEHESDMLGYAQDAWEDQNAEHIAKIDVHEHTLVCECCNYKGEGEGGLEAYVFCKNLRVWRGKSQSFSF